MKLKIFIFCFLLLLLPFNAFSDDRKDNLYRSPNGLVELKDPKLLFGQKTLIRDNAGIYEVQFLNDVGSFFSLMVISDPKICLFDKVNLESSLGKCSKKVLLDQYWKFSKKSKLLQSTFINDIQGGITLDEVVLPGGSTIKQTRSDGSSNKLDGIRIAAAFQVAGTILLAQFDPGFPPGLLGDLTVKKEELKITSKDREKLIELIKSVRLNNG